MHNHIKKKTILYEQHKKAGAKLVDFAGWEMPLDYGSQLREHHKVRTDSGVFDVSHMAIIDISGESALDYLSYLLANNPQRLVPGKALYTCLLNDAAGILDDLIVYQLSKQRYRIIANANNREQDLHWLTIQAKHFTPISIIERRDLAILALQGPNARSKARTTFSLAQQQAIENLKPFHCIEQEDWCIARTGYTGEDGLEVMLPNHQAEVFWQQVLEQDIAPCGLGARDTLRLEAGFNLHGADMDSSTTPLESNLAWTIAWEPSNRNFIGRTALVQQQKNPQRKLIGLVLTEKGPLLRRQQPLFLAQAGQGKITSGGYSPTLNLSIAFARIPWSYNGDDCHVMIRDEKYRARIIQPPFVRHGQKAFT